MANGHGMASDQGEQRHHEMGAESVAVSGADSRSIMPMGGGASTGTRAAKTHEHGRREKVGSIFQGKNKFEELNVKNPCHARPTTSAINALVAGMDLRCTT